jgi:hypothetical protein
MTNTPADYILADYFAKRLDPNETAVQFLAAYPKATITPNELIDLANSREAARRVANREYLQNELNRVQAALTREPVQEPESHCLLRIGDSIYGESQPATPEYLAELQSRLQEAF